ncbi:MAG: hypothetical protein IKA10_03935 [Oscillospiraceae bacterium]|nr:hypothetical protein [Oscillospiraceae bacterium]
MKKLKNIYYFLPAIVLILIIVVSYFSSVLSITSYTNILINLSVMILAGIFMCKGKAWGAYFALLFFTVWNVWDYIVYINTPVDPFDIVNRRIPSITICWPVILFYFNCAIAFIKKIKR